MTVCTFQLTANKRCPCCNKTLARDKFYANRTKKDGFGTYCKLCQKQKQYKSIRDNKGFRDNVRAGTKKWQQCNPEKMREYGRLSQKKRRMNPKYRVSNSVGRMLYRSLCEDKNKKKKKDILGYSGEQLAGHLENQFVDGMTWGNYGKWHVDHVIPIAFFEFTSPGDVEFKMCWRLENLRPLWAKENISKGTRIVT